MSVLEAQDSGTVFAYLASKLGPLMTGGNSRSSGKPKVQNVINGRQHLIVREVNGEIT